MREDKLGEMGEIEDKEGCENLGAHEHKDSNDDKLGVGKVFHVDRGHGRGGDGGDRSEEEVHVMRT